MGLPGGWEKAASLSYGLAVTLPRVKWFRLDPQGIGAELDQIRQEVVEVKAKLDALVRPRSKLGPSAPADHRHSGQRGTEGLVG